jgi:hypothetical protein
MYTTGLHFRNFTSNSFNLNLRGQNEAIAEQIRNVLKDEREKRKAEQEAIREQQQKQKEEEQTLNGETKPNQTKENARVRR